MEKRRRYERRIVSEIEETRGAKGGKKSLGCFDGFRRGCEKWLQRDELVMVSKETRRTTSIKLSQEFEAQIRS